MKIFTEKLENHVIVRFYLRASVANINKYSYFLTLKDNFYGKQNPQMIYT